jgi:hypothetical protein
MKRFKSHKFSQAVAVADAFAQALAPTVFHGFLFRILVPDSQWRV